MSESYKDINIGDMVFRLLHNRRHEPEENEIFYVGIVIDLMPYSTGTKPIISVLYRYDNGLVFKRNEARRYLINVTDPLVKRFKFSDPMPTGS